MMVMHDIHNVQIKKVAFQSPLPWSVSHPNGSMSKSGQEFPFRPFPPIILAAEKSLVHN